MFGNFLPLNVLCRIAAHDLIKDEDAVDEIYRSGSPSGGFTMSSTIKIIRMTTKNMGRIKWKKIWSIRVPQRMWFFIWLAFQDHIMTN